MLPGKLSLPFEGLSYQKSCEFNVKKGVMKENVFTVMKENVFIYLEIISRAHFKEG